MNLKTSGFNTTATVNQYAERDSLYIIDLDLVVGPHSHNTFEVQFTQIDRSTLGFYAIESVGARRRGGGGFKKFALAELALVGIARDELQERYPNMDITHPFDGDALDEAVEAI